MAICYEIRVRFIRRREGEEQDIGSIPLQYPSEEPLTPFQLRERIPGVYQEFVAKITNSDPSRANFFGDYVSFRVASVYEC